MTALTQDQKDALIAHGMAIAVHASERPDELAIKTVHGESSSWRTLNERANQLANALKTEGIEPGASVALLSHNAIEFIEVWAACQRIGLRLTPINWHQSADVVSYIVDNCDAQVFVASARFAATAAAAREAAPNVKIALAFAGDIPNFRPYEDFLNGHPTTAPAETEMGSFMLYTSGTTGRPKGVYRKARPLPSQLTATILETAAFVSGADKALVTGPLYHAAPLSLNLVTPLNAGVTCILMDKWDAEEMLKLIETEQITHTHLVPTMFHRLLQLPEDIRNRYDLSSLRWILHGAAPCPIHIKQAMLDWLGPIIFEYYSSTEGGGVFIGPEDWLAKPGSVGKPVAGVGIKLLDADGQPAKPNVPSTIYIQAPETGRFVYYKDEAKTNSAYQGDHFTLGDLGYLDDDGFLFLTGRSAELIISGGVNIYPAEIDAVVIQHPAVADAAVIGAPNEEWGEEIKAVVELKPGTDPSPKLAEDIRTFAAERLPGYQKPRSVDFVETLPRSPAGKVLRQQVRSRYWPD